jgi:zeaxanthin epoxidase
LQSAKTRQDIVSKLEHYQQRRLVRSAAVQGLSRFASDIIIRGFDTPAKIVWEEGTTLPRLENFNYAGIVTKILQPILPLFFIIQFNFLYEGWRNKTAIDLGAALGLATIGSLMLLLCAASVGEAGILASIGLEAFIGVEGAIDFEAISTAVRELLSL